MVARNWFIAAVLAVGPFSMVAAAAAESAPVAKAPAGVDVALDRQALRSEIDGYIRELNEQMRAALAEELRRTLPAKIELASNELRSRG